MGRVKVDCEISMDPQFLHLAVNAFMGMMNNMDFQDMFESVVTVPGLHQKGFKYSFPDLLTTVVAVLHELTHGDIDQIRNIGQGLVSFETVTRKGPTL